jgi:hypothetical protein
MAEDDLSVLLDDVPLIVTEIWFMHVGVPPYFSLTFRRFLDMCPIGCIG